jgi:transcriptional regulator with XRE-family HTH domain
MDLKKLTGGNIKRLRKLNGINQDRMGKMLAVRNNTVSSYEKGANFPSIEVLVKMAEIFDCSTDEILGVENNKRLNSEWLYLIRELTNRGYTPFRINKIIDMQEDILKLMHDNYKG